MQQGAGHDRAGALLWALWDPALGQDASSAPGLDEMLHPVCKGEMREQPEGAPDLCCWFSRSRAGHKEGPEAGRDKDREQQQGTKMEDAMLTGRR